MDCRQQREHEHGHERDGDERHDDACVWGVVHPVGQRILGDGTPEETHAGRRQTETHRAADCREHAAFDQELPDQPIRLAPSDERTAISRARREVWPSIRLATLAAEISTTRKPADMNAIHAVSFHRPK